MVEYSQFNTPTENGLMPLPHHWSLACKDVLNERARQISQEGWTIENDDEHERGELAAAGGCYALHAHDDLAKRRYPDGPAWWPFPVRWWKPKGVRENLVRAAALIIAEIERIDRKTSQQSKGA